MGVPPPEAVPLRQNSFKGEFIMKKMICTILAAALLLTLAACGSPIDINYDPPATQEATPAQGSIPTQEPTPDPTEPPPSLDEIIYEISQYAEDEGLQLTDDANLVISDMYDNGVTDAYGIFEYLRSWGMCVPESTDGIVVFKISYGSVYNYRSTGKFMYQAFTAELDSIDPETGAVTHLRTFSSEDTHSCSAALNGVGGTRRRTLMNFSADLSKMTANLTLEDGSEHVGWIDEKGNFTDVSQMVTPDAGDFGALTKHSNPCFGPDNYFYFKDLTNAVTKWGGVPQSAQIKRVPLDNLTISAVETLVEDDPWPTYAICFLPDGSVDPDKGYWDYYDEAMTYPAICGNLTDWLSENEGIGEEMINQAPVIDMIYKYTLSGIKDIFEWYSERTPLVPSVAGRTNWNPILSPDKSQVAFFSRLTTGTDISPYLFIVPVDGGDPVKVPTDYTFYDSNNLHTYLLTWNSAD